jgi:hypothetical protein
MRRDRPKLKVIQRHGAKGKGGERIALSLVHPRERIDIPANAIVRIEVHEDVTFAEKGTGKLWTFASPCVGVYLSQAIGERICRPEPADRR